MIWALVGALLVGLSLGLLGSGGSILTVPVLVYLLDQPEKVAIAGSLAIVGSISLVGALPYAWRRQVDWRSVLYFGLPGMLGTFLGAWSSRWVSGEVQLGLFALVSLAAAWAMFRPVRTPEPGRPPRRFWKLILDGLAVGALTGLVGVGGGFLIVPALVIMARLPMTLAVGTSLVIIALKSGSGLYKYVDVLTETGLSLDWRVLGLFTAVGIVGSFAGQWVGQHLPQATLRRGFAVLLVVMGVGILVNTILRY